MLNRGRWDKSSAGKKTLQLSCSWLTSVDWVEDEGGSPGLRVWDAVKCPVQVPKPMSDPLPSDSRFREDLHALKVLSSAPSYSHMVPAGLLVQSAGFLATVSATVPMYPEKTS